MNKEPNITFRQFMRAYNFREASADGNITDTNTIRIYFPDNDFWTTNWFEFGIYDFASETSKEKKLEQVLSKEILDSYICSIRCGVEDNLLNIHLTKDKEFNY